MLTDVRRRRLALPETGIEIALLDWGGDGPLALLHHANGFCAATWAPVAEQLRPYFRVVAMDARGHGDSSKPSPEDGSPYGWPRFGEDTAAVARLLAAEHPSGRVALGLGHSFGGTSLLMAAGDHGIAFGRLVLLDPVLPPPSTGSGLDPQRSRRGGELVERTLRRRAVFGSRDEARATWSEKSLFAGWDPRAFDLYLAEGLFDRDDGDVELKCAPEVEGAIFSNSFGFDAWSVASRVTAPTLLVWAERGDFPRPVYEAVVAKMPDGRIVDAPTGHLVPMEAPDLVVREVLDFAGGLATQERSTG